MLVPLLYIIVLTMTFLMSTTSLRIIISMPREEIAGAFLKKVTLSEN